jgi:hypothetical protein
VPDVPADTWTLRIHGMVDNEVELSFEDLLGMRLIERRVTLTCVSNQVGGLLAGNATWIGVPLKDIFECGGCRAAPTPVFATSADGWTCATAISDMIDREGFLAISMNGEPLPLEHGFPARVVVPGLYGMVSATKWVVDLEITKLDDVEAYWTARNWSERAPIKTQSRIDTPRGFQQLTPAEDGTLTMGGVAWAQTTGIAKVEVRIDDEPWQDATLGTEDTLATWRLWTWTWDAPTAGNHNITVRATDRSGYLQTSDQAETLPTGHGLAQHPVRGDVTDGRPVRNEREQIMRTTIRKSLAVGAVASLAMFSAACGSDEDSPTDAPEDTTSEEPTEGKDDPASDEPMADPAANLVGSGCTDYAEANPDGPGFRWPAWPPSRSAPPRAATRCSRRSLLPSRARSTPRSTWSAR